MRNNLFRYFLIFLGSVSLILGVIGIFLPLLPTTPFLLLTAFCYFKGSPELYKRLINQPYLGPYIVNYKKYRVISLRAKISSITLLWVSITYCIFFVTNLLWLRILLSIIAVCVTAHILSFKSKKA